MCHFSGSIQQQILHSCGNQVEHCGDGIAVAIKNQKFRKWLFWKGCSYKNEKNYEKTIITFHSKVSSAENNSWWAYLHFCKNGEDFGPGDPCGSKKRMVPSAILMIVRVKWCSKKIRTTILLQSLGTCWIGWQGEESIDWHVSLWHTYVLNWLSIINFRASSSPRTKSLVRACMWMNAKTTLKKSS